MTVAAAQAGSACAAGAGASSPEPSDLRARQVAWLAAAVFAVSIGYGALLPLLPGWLETLLPQATVIEQGQHVGFLSGAYAAGLLLGAPFWGAVSDRWGRTPILLVGLLGYVLSLLLLLWPSTGLIAATYALRATAGFFVAAVVPVATALVAEHTPESKRARRFAWLGAMTLLGFLLGPAFAEAVPGLWRLASETQSPSSVRTVVILSSASLAVLTILGVARSLPAQRGHRPPPSKLAPLAALGGLSILWWLAGAVMFVLTGFEVAIVLQGGKVSGTTPPSPALMLVVCSLAMLAVNAVLFVTDLLAKASARLLTAAGLAVSIAGLALLAATSDGAWMYVGVALAAAGTGLLLPVISYVAAGVGKETLGIVMGALAAALALGQTAGSFIAGWLHGLAGQASFAWLATALAVLLVVLARGGKATVALSTLTAQTQRVGDH